MRTRRLALGLALLTAVTAACSGGSDGDDGGEQGASTTRDRGGTLTASDVGVTESTIKVGVVVFDLEALRRIGLKFEYGDIQAQWQAYFDKVNAAGGVGGRKIEPVFRVFNPIDADSLRAACAALAQDEKVFAVLNTSGFIGDPVLCITEQRGMPFLAASGFVDEYYEKSKGLLWSSMQYEGPASGRTFSQVLDERGTLEGKRIGVVADEANLGTEGVRTSLLPELERLGYDPEVVSLITLNDFPTQVRVSVTQMNDANVEVVLLLANPTVNKFFVDEAQAQQMEPTYILSDLAIPLDRIYDLYGDHFDGAQAITSLRTGEAAVGEREATVDAQCRETYETATGQKLVRGREEYVSTLQACSLVDIFGKAVEAAGPDLTRQSFGEAMAGLGKVDVAFTAGGSFGPDDFVAADESLRTIQWAAECKCWRTVDEFQRVDAG